MSPKEREVFELYLDEYPDEQDVLEGVQLLFEDGWKREEIEDYLEANRQDGVFLEEKIRRKSNNGTMFSFRQKVNIQHLMFACMVGLLCLFGLQTYKLFDDLIPTKDFYDQVPEDGRQKISSDLKHLNCEFIRNDTGFTIVDSLTKASFSLRSSCLEMHLAMHAHSGDSWEDSEIRIRVGTESSYYTSQSANAQGCDSAITEISMSIGEVWDGNEDNLFVNRGRGYYWSIQTIDSNQNWYNSEKYDITLDRQDSTEGYGWSRRENRHNWILKAYEIDSLILPNRILAQKTNSALESSMRMYHLISCAHFTSEKASFSSLNSALLNSAFPSLHKRDFGLSAYNISAQNHEVSLLALLREKLRHTTGHNDEAGRDFVAEALELRRNLDRISSMSSSMKLRIMLYSLDDSGESVDISSFDIDTYVREYIHNLHSEHFSYMDEVEQSERLPKQIETSVVSLPLDYDELSREAYIKLSCSYSIPQEVRVFDCMGKPVFNDDIPPNTNEWTFDLPALPPGLYSVVIEGIHHPLVIE